MIVFTLLALFPLENIYWFLVIQKTRITTQHQEDFGTQNPSSYDSIVDEFQISNRTKCLDRTRRISSVVTKYGNEFACVA
jgi:hypothetical protein